MSEQHGRIPRTVLIFANHRRFCSCLEGKFSGRREYNYAAIRPHPPYGDDKWTVLTRFDRFAGGKYRRSDYAVSVSWEDVERIIETLSEAGCPEALAVREGVADMTKLHYGLAKTALEAEYAKAFANLKIAYSIICLERTVELR